MFTPSRPATLPHPARLARQDTPHTASWSCVCVLFGGCRIRLRWWGGWLPGVIVYAYTATVCGVVVYAYTPTVGAPAGDVAVYAYTLTRMPRPVSGTSRNNIVSTRLSDAEYRAVLATGVTRSVWLRQAVRAALGIAPMGAKLPPLPKPDPPATPAPRLGTKRPSRPITRRAAPKAEVSEHRHKRERVGEKWVGGTDVGEWRCADPDCGVTLGILQ
jgi:hypothetical protein